MVKQFTQLKPKLIHLICLVVLTPLALVAQTPEPDRIDFNCQNQFMNGTNVAWGQYGRDVGEGYRPDLQWFETMFQNIQAQGGNSIRWWLHTNASFSPNIDANGYVSGMASTVIPDMEDVLDLAWQYNIGVDICLFSFDLLQNQWEMDPEANRKFLTNPDNVQSYIDNALTPMVNQLKDHPALLCWEVFNEPEGMTNEFGWTEGGKINMSDVQMVVNKIAGAIHRLDSKNPVSNGSWSFKATTDVGGNYNYYTDERLIAAGGDQDGYLDFYMVHYYSWAGTELSPFHHDVDYWQLDKPLLVGEFYAQETFGVAQDDLFKVLYDRGYAGAWGWQYTESNLWNNMTTGMRRVYDQYAQNIDLDKNACNYLEAKFSADKTEACSGEIVTFTSNSSGTITSYDWSFGDGASPSTATGEGPHEVTYSTGGEKTIQLMVTDNNSETNSLEKTILVNTDDKTFTISSDNLNCSENQVTFTATVDPPLAAAGTSTNITIASFNSDWDTGTLEQKYELDAQTGLVTPATGTNLNTYLHGSWQNAKGTWIEFTGTFCEQATALIESSDQSASGSKTIEIFIDGQSAGTKDFSTATSFSATIPAGVHTVRFSNIGEDWIQLQRIAFTNLCGQAVYTWYINDLPVNGETESTFTTGILNDGDVIKAKVEDPSIKCVGEGKLSNEITYNCTVTSLITPDLSKIIAFPNPASDKVSLNLKGNIHWKLFDAYGAEVLTGSGKELSLKNLSSGIYTIEIVNNGSAVRERIIKN